MNALKLLIHDMSLRSSAGFRTRDQEEHHPSKINQKDLTRTPIKDFLTEIKCGKARKSN